MDAHFRNAFANRLAVVEISMFSRPDAMDDASACRIVFQADKPSVEIVRTQEGVHGGSVSVRIRSRKREAVAKTKSPPLHIGRQSLTDRTIWASSSMAAVRQTLKNQTSINSKESVMETRDHLHLEAWNKGKLVDQKAPLKPKDIWAIRIHLQNAHEVRDLAIDSKLRGGERRQH